ncbi:MAG: hypothetical protein ACR2MW_07485 [Chthoniobacterales bacterium]
MKFHHLIMLGGVALLLPACSMFSASGRQQAAYARYIRKSSQGRVHQQKMFHSNKPAMPVTMPEESSESSSPVAVAENVP